jgi:metallo-beta-lactamase family protein
MRISFHGATREVTGSCYLVETDKARVLVDCGMYQGGQLVEARNFRDFEFDASTVDAVFVTHAHLDHTGRLPKLVKAGFRGKIYATPPTVQLAKLVLEDAYQIMLEEEKREGRPLLYEEKDIIAAMHQFVSVDYSHSLQLGDLRIRFRDAGHIFGSAFIEINEAGNGRATFSGDLGNEHVPILRETAQLAETDVLVMESTYGNRVHEDESTRGTKLKETIMHTVKQNGVLIVPAFAIERTQQLLYELNHLRENGLIPHIDAYLDSPLAIKATEVIKAFPQYYDKEALQKVAAGDDLFDFEGLHVTPTRDQSKGINEAPRPKLIIAGAGMMNGGRILHHLVRYLGDPRSTILIIGYQAEGTLGRKLYRGEKIVDVLGEHIQVRATVSSIGAYSAHADQNKLVQWVGGAVHKPGHVYCTHGDEEASAALVTRLRQELGVAADVPRLGEAVEF